MYLVISNSDMCGSHSGYRRFGVSYCLHRLAVLQLDLEDEGTTLSPETSVPVFQSTQSNVPEELHLQFKIDIHDFRDVFC